MTGDRTGAGQKSCSGVYGHRVIEVTSLDNPVLDVSAHLTQAQLRSKLEPEKGIFIAESPKVIWRALEGGLRPLSLLMGRAHLEPETELIEACSKAWALSNKACGSGALPERYELESKDENARIRAALNASSEEFPVYTGDEKLLSALTGFKLTRGVLCAFRRPVLPRVEDLLANAQRVAVLEGIVDHTNVGAIFRSAAALDVDAVLVTPTCCDPLYRRAVRVSMGTVFQVPWTRLGNDVHDWPDAGLAKLHELGFKTAALALSDDSIPLDAPELMAEPKLAMVFGTEGDGLSKRTIAGCDYTVRIPMSHNVDSLNVAAASAVTFWQLCRPLHKDAR